MNSPSNLVDLDYSPPSTHSFQYRGGGSTSILKPVRGRPFESTTPMNSRSVLHATPLEFVSVSPPPTSEFLMQTSAPSVVEEPSPSDLDLFLSLASSLAPRDVLSSVASSSSKSETSLPSRSASPTPSFARATVGTSTQSASTIRSPPLFHVPGPSRSQQRHLGTHLPSPSKRVRLSITNPLPGRPFVVARAGGSLGEPSTSDFVNSVISGTGVEEDSSNPLRSLAMWANNLQILYATFEGVPLTLAQVIALRRSGHSPSIVRIGSSLVSSPVNPLSVNPLRQGLTVSEACLNAGVPLVPVPQLLKVPEITRSPLTSDCLEALTTMYTSLGTSPTEALAFATNDIENTGFPNFDNLINTSFNQGNDNRPYEKYLWSLLVIVTCIKTTNKCLAYEQDLIRNFLKEAHPICENYFCGTGTLRGQVGRIAKGYLVASSVQIGGEFHSDYLNGIDDDELLRCLELVMPYPHCGMVTGSIEPSKFIVETNSKVSSEHGIISDYPLYIVSGSAHSGPPWSGKVLKINTILQDLCLTIDFCNTVGSGLDDEGDIVNSDYDDLIKLVHIKSKNEVQNFSENFYFKNRNIFPANVVTANLFSSFQRMSHRRIYNFINHKTSKILAGIPLCTSGMGQVLEKMLDELVENGRSVTFYADNIHICEHSGFGKVLYCSIDLSSEESRHDERIVTITLKHILRSCYNATLITTANTCSVSKVTAMSSSFANLILNFGPKMLVNCIGCIGNSQIPLPGLPSGCPLTFDINSCATAPAICEMISCESALLCDNGEPSGRCHEILKNFRLPYKVEFMSGIDETGTSEFEASYNDPFEIGHEGSIIRLNMLGFDAAVLKILDPDTPNDPIFLTFGVLNEERYQRMFWFNKSSWSDYKDVANRLIILRNRLMKFCVAYLTLGGFLPSRSSATLAVISNTSYSIQAILGPDVDPTAILGLMKEDSDEVLLQAIEEIGIHGQASGDISSAVRQALLTGHINFGAVIKITQGEEVLNRLTDLSYRHPDQMPPGLLNFDALSEDFILGESSINSKFVENSP